MPSAVFCYAPGDASAARDIGAFLEVNLPFTAFYDEGLVRPGFDLIDAVERGLSAELVVVLLSPESVPKRWERERWEPVFVQQALELGSQIAYVQVGECRFPELFRRHALHDYGAGALQAKRDLKRQVLARRRAPRNTVLLPPLVAALGTDQEQLRRDLADVPGFRADVERGAALEFAHACSGDFEGAFWIDAKRRTRAGVLGDIAQVLGLRLSGSSEQNQAALRMFCLERRCLFVFERLCPSLQEAVTLGGRASVVVVETTTEMPELPAVPELCGRFANWSGDAAGCLALLGDAQCVLDGLASWERAKQLGGCMLALLKNAERLAEANEILEIVIASAIRNADQDALRQFRWEQSWILGHWGEPYRSQLPPSMPLGETSQLGFDFLQ